MKNYIYGAYGTGNLGDDLLLMGAIKEHSGEDIEVVSYGIPYTNGVNNYIDHFEFINNCEKYVRKGDRVTFAGGGLFWAASHAEDMYDIARKSIKNGADVRIKRIGAQGFHCNIDAVRKLMELCSFISVRDINSVQILKEYNITNKAVFEEDYVLTLKEEVNKIKEQKKHSHSSKIRIGINHSATPFFHDEKHRKKTLHLYSTIADEYKKNCDFYYIPHTRHFNVIDQNDIINGEWFWKCSNGLITPFSFPKSTDELLNMYSQMDAVIGWRYHLLVLGNLFELKTAFLGSPGGHKYGAFALENNIPQINFDLSTSDILGSMRRWINRMLTEK
jgi:hypothetical protein